MQDDFLKKMENLQKPEINDLPEMREFKMVLLKVFSLLPYPVPESDGRTSTGLKSWTAVWPETVEAAAAMHTVARLCRKTELLILRKDSYPYSAVRPARRTGSHGSIEEKLLGTTGGNLL